MSGRAGLARLLPTATSLFPAVLSPRNSQPSSGKSCPVTKHCQFPWCTQVQTLTQIKPSVGIVTTTWHGAGHAGNTPDGNFPTLWWVSGHASRAAHLMLSVLPRRRIVPEDPVPTQQLPRLASLQRLAWGNDLSSSGSLVDKQAFAATVR